MSKIIFFIMEKITVGEIQVMITLLVASKIFQIFLKLHPTIAMLFNYTRRA